MWSFRRGRFFFSSALTVLCSVEKKDNEKGERDVCLLNLTSTQDLVSWIYYV